MSGSITRSVDSSVFNYGYDGNDCALPIAAKHQIRDFLDEELESGDYITLDQYLEKHEIAL
ncbi:MAG: hypothetical protein LH631_10045 [Alkalinema sp. CAN_BIN05]|nr:hypothetical protein [Alkalinema sp. CAN_BIN05]